MRGFIITFIFIGSCYHISEHSVVVFWGGLMFFLNKLYCRQVLSLYLPQDALKCRNFHSFYRIGLVRRHNYSQTFLPKYRFIAFFPLCFFVHFFSSCFFWNVAPLKSRWFPVFVLVHSFSDCCCQSAPVFVLVHSFSDCCFQSAPVFVLVHSFSDHCFQSATVFVVADWCRNLRGQKGGK